MARSTETPFDLQPFIRYERKKCTKAYSFPIQIRPSYMNQQQDFSTPSPLPQTPATSGAGFSDKYAPQSVMEKPFSTNSFVIEDSFYRSRLPRPVHWSVAWSDLMMTMFILFLTMFVYQASHEEFLVSNTPEIIGGSTTEAIDILGDGDLIVPIVPLTQKAPLITSGTVKKVEKVHINDLDIDSIFRNNTVFVEPSQETSNAEATVAEPEPITNTEPSTPAEQTDVIEPAPLIVSDQTIPEFQQTDTFTDMYDMSRQALLDGKLDQFASIELVPDKTMRIILTGDLLFFSGQADLSNRARKSLTLLAAVMKNSPYMVNVIGHTDNQPMHSSRFATNWELSVVRASSVARFLIEEMGMNPAQFIVSGYGSNRPRRPNTNIDNRAANRRVEIIISKRLAPAVKATPENLL
jgi:chemotaxis protein MotB